MPTDSAKVSPVAMLVMIIVIALPHHEEIKGQEVFRSISNFKVYVTILMCKPIDDRAMDGS